MNRSTSFAICTLLAATLAFASAPDVKYTQTTVTKFHGGMSMLMKMAGASGPQTSTIMISGNKQRSDDGDRSTIVDLDREAMINIDHKKKEYTEMTFAEWREMMSKLKGSGKSAKMDKADRENVDVKFDVKVDKTGERQTINGYECEKVIVTLTMEGEQKPTADDPTSGGKGSMMVTSTQWLTPRVAGWEEAAAFAKKFTEKVGSAMGMNTNAMAASVMGKLGPAMKKLEEEAKKLTGVPVKTESAFKVSGQAAEQPGGEAAAGEQKIPSSLGGLLGGLGKKKSSPGSAETGNEPLFESTTILESISTGGLEAGLFAPPMNYKMKAMKQ
jgi:hypothetical protein